MRCDTNHSSKKDSVLAFMIKELQAQKVALATSAEFVLAINSTIQGHILKGVLA
jgi:hypothetical protein